MQMLDAAALSGLISFISIFMIVMLVLTIIARWKMFTKAGEAGWKSLIPIYCDYTLFKIVWNAKSFWIYTLSAVGSVALNILGGQYAVVGGQLVATGGGNFFIGILAYLASIITLVYDYDHQLDTRIGDYHMTNDYLTGIFSASGISFRLRKIADFYDWTPYVNAYGLCTRNSWGSSSRNCAPATRSGKEQAADSIEAKGHVLARGRRNTPLKK